MKFGAQHSMWARSMGVALLGALLIPAATASAAVASAGLAGFWSPIKPVEVLRTTSGAEPPLTAAGRAAYDRHLAAARAGDRGFDIGLKCLPIGLTRLMAESSFELVIAAKEADLIFEWNRVTHPIPFRDAHLKEYPYPTYLGHSIGALAAGVLSIDSVYFNADTVLDSSGLPHGEQLRVTQRLRLADANTLVSRLTIVDPDMYRAPWQTELRYRRLSMTQLSATQGLTPGFDPALKEDVCVERLQLRRLNTGK